MRNMQGSGAALAWRLTLAESAALAVTQDRDRPVDLSQTDSVRGFEDCGRKASTAAGMCASNAGLPVVTKMRVGNFIFAL